MAGILPFGAVFIELFFILSVCHPSIIYNSVISFISSCSPNPQFCSIFFQAIWENQFYYLFGFLFLVFIILAMCCSLIAVVVIYFQLCAEVSEEYELHRGHLKYSLLRRGFHFPVNSLSFPCFPFFCIRNR